MAKVAVLTTGGTVAMRHDLARGGAVPALSAADLTAVLPPGAPELVVEEVCPWQLERELVPCSRLEERVALVKLAVGMGAEPLEDALARGARGVVIEALGASRLPPW
ncbi:MAG: hypothetical protein RML46_06405 [Anaerolineae bacterium]|nr:hypothetical protein [Anaerolineae bacterium]MDW8068525.1 hypothetical protein [Anaerolineae bacterium]